MQRGLEIRLYMSPEQEAYIRRLSGGCRFLYNSLVGYSHDLSVDNLVIPSSEQRKEFLKKLEEENPWLKELHSKVRQQSVRDYNTAVGNFFRRLKKNEGKLEFRKPKKKKKESKATPPPPSKKKKRTPTFYDKVKYVPRFHKKGVRDTCYFNRQAFMGIKGNRISLVTQLRDIYFKCSREDERYLNRNQDKISSITVHVKPSGKFEAKVTIEDTRIKPLPPMENPKYMGIDVGLKDAMTTYDGVEFVHVPNPKPLKHHEKSIKRAQRQLAKRQFGSHRYERLRRLKAKREEKVANIRRDFLQKMSTKLVRENQGIGVEDLNVAGMMKNHHLARSIGDASWSEFFRELEYKCKWYGREFVKVGRYKATSQKCSACGHQNPLVKDMNVRVWTCPNCRAEHDRDENASANVRVLSFWKQLGLSSPEVTHADRSTVGARSARNTHSRPGRNVKQKVCVNDC